MAVPFLIPLPLLIAVPLILLIATVGAPALPRLIARRRQAAYDAAVAPNMVRLELTVGRGRSTGTDAAIAAIRGLHPHRRMGVDRRVASRLAASRVASGLARRRAALADRGGERRAGPVLTGPSRRSIRGSKLPKFDRSDRPAVVQRGRSAPAFVWARARRTRERRSNVLTRLATILRSQSDDAEVRLRLLARPIDPEAWQRSLYPEEASSSFGQILREAIVDVILNRESADRARTAPALSAPELEARTRKRKESSASKSGCCSRSPASIAAKARRSSGLPSTRPRRWTRRPRRSSGICVPGSVEPTAARCARGLRTREPLVSARSVLR